MSSFIQHYMEINEEKVLDLRPKMKEVLNHQRNLCALCTHRHGAHANYCATSQALYPSLQADMIAQYYPPMQSQNTVSAYQC